jgi:RsiW-degrading membrane proteinase PrsW (M82 family)
MGSATGPQGGGQPDDGRGACARAAPDPDRGRRILGLVLWLLGTLIGLGLFLFLMIVPLFTLPQQDFVRWTMLKAALVAYLPVTLYLFVPYLFDRFDPEPLWALAMVFLWGAMMAMGFSSVINTMAGMLVGDFFSSAVSAPVVEEATKAAAVIGIMVFLRREFDGVVDAIVYATFAAIGFAASENVMYYLRGGLQGEMGQLFVLRGVLTPWLHPLFTAMTGLGIGVAREHGARWARALFPLLGFAAAVLLHACWNVLPLLFGTRAVLLNLVIGLLLSLAFMVFLGFLVRRQGRIIRRHLEDEVTAGNLTREEWALIGSPFSRLKAAFSRQGRTVRKFIRAGVRLALSKWHMVRAVRSQRHTISADFIGPLRQELARLRSQMETGPR